MKRIIRLNAVKTKNEASSERAKYLHRIKVSEAVTIYGGTVIALPTKKVNMSVAAGINSASLQKILNQQPSVIPYLVVLSSIAFLVISSIWAWNTKVEEASLLFSLFPFGGREKALITAAPKNKDVASIPLEQLPLMVERIVPFKPTMTLVKHSSFSVINLGDIQLMHEQKLGHESVSGKVVAIFPSQTNNPVSYQTEIKIIPKQLKNTSAHIKYQSKPTTKVNIHTYRVADMFFKE
ncbi:hypothetical protein NIES4071_48020 [Calothrix sp. NIES-4071]|nr:hypothetical protein NIES4071_48020 [Calothrix sp. NIES-4071]BAZ59114.1 hypothetical protein NIES4105_47960 [Calothrix sp. NIES-4105]